MSVDLTIYKTGNNVDAANRASINIKNNNEKTQKTGFDGVIVSGMEVDTKKLDKNTYTSLIKQADDVKSQIMQSASDAKANLKALFNRLSGADAVKIDEDGFNLNDATPDDCVNIIERIKIELAAHCDTYTGDMSGIDVSKIEKVVGSAGMAQQVAANMQDTGLPLTDDNISDMAESLSGMENGSLSEDTKNYLVKNNMQPTIKNIQIAQAASKGFGDKMQTLSRQELEQLMPQIKEIIGKAKLEVNDNNINNAITFISQDIPVTEQNLVYKNQLDMINLDYDETSLKIAQGMADGSKAEEVSLIKDYDSAVVIADAIDIVKNADYDAVARATDMYGDNVSIKSIEEAMAQYNIGNKSVAQEQGVVQNKPEYEDNYKKLLEIQILLTPQAGMHIYNNGIDILSVSIDTLHENLLAYDREKAMEQIAIQLADDIDSQVPTDTGAAALSGVLADVNGTDNKTADFISMYQLSLVTRRAIRDISYAPDEVIGAVYKENMQSQAVINIAGFSEMGSSLKERFRQAGNSYEAVGTKVRKDLGDSLKNAVEASSESILSQLGMENTKANSDAVRILSYNNIDITKNNIEQIKQIKESLNTLIEQMNPETVLNMIKDNINPLTSDIESVNDYLINKNKDSDNTDKFSRFLYKLDKTGGISEEERRQFIGIYKMINIYTKDAGNAIGALVKQGADITMENLCRAYDSRKQYGMDNSVGDDTDIAMAGQVRYYLNLFDNTASSVTPLTLKEVNSEKSINTRTVENFCESVQDAYDAAAEAEYMDAYMEVVRAVSAADDEVLHQLEQAEQPVTINNIEAMQELVSGSAYGRIFGADRNKAEKIIDSMSDEKSLREAIESLDDEKSESIPQSAGADINSYDSVRQAALKNNIIDLVKNLNRQRDYRIPVLSDDKIGVMKLTMISDGSESGRISIRYDNESCGEVSIELKVTDDTFDVFGVCTGENNDFAGLLQNAAEKIKEEFNFEKTNVYANSNDKVTDITYEKSESQPSSKLYRIAKSFISDLM